jgi:hypothetical protein
LGGAALLLDQGFWRESDASDNIAECITDRMNCLGGLTTGQQSCSANHIGPLCEECDIAGGFTKISTSACFECSQIGLSICIVILVLFIFVIYILISTDSSVKQARRKFKIKSMPQSEKNRYYASMIMKILVYYVQILSVIQIFGIRFSNNNG